MGEEEKSKRNVGWRRCCPCELETQKKTDTLTSASYLDLFMEDFGHLTFCPKTKMESGIEKGEIPVPINRMIKSYGEGTSIEIVNDDRSIQSRILEKIGTTVNENPFFIADLGDIIEKYRTWKKCFPRVDPFFAVKSNDLYPVIRILADLGLSFDCASQVTDFINKKFYRRYAYLILKYGVTRKQLITRESLPLVVKKCRKLIKNPDKLNEIEKILNLGVEPSRIIYANSIKQSSFIKFAAKNGVSLMTFDNEEELYKIKSIYSEARLLLRIRPPDSGKVTFYLGKKFGCHPELERHLLEVAKRLGLNVVGVSFHAGTRSGCLDSGAFETAISQARGTFNIGVELGFDMKILDIGGGIPGHELPNFSFEQMAKAVNQSLDKHFPDDNKLRIIAEPGRYFVASSFTFAANIIAKRTADEAKHDQSDTNQIMYYINDGIYGNYYVAFIDPGCLKPSHFKDVKENKLYNSLIWGPTCDALDLVAQNVKLPEHNVGEWLYFKNMGAYSKTTVSNFNDMQLAKQHYICTKDLWESLYGTTN